MDEGEDFNIIFWHKCLQGKPSFVKKDFFMRSLFIYFFVHFLSEKKDDFEGCLKGVDGC